MGSLAGCRSALLGSAPRSPAVVIRPLTLPPTLPSNMATPSAAPEVRLVNAFPRPYENAVATARTCYSARGHRRRRRRCRARPDLPEEKRRQRRRAARPDREVDLPGRAPHDAPARALPVRARRRLAAVPLDLPPRPPLLQLRAGEPALRGGEGRARTPSRRSTGEALAVYEACAERQMARVPRPHRAADARRASATYFGVFPARAPRSPRSGRARSRRRRRRSRATSCRWPRTRTSTTRSPGSRCCATGGCASTYDAPQRAARSSSAKMVEALLAHDPLFATILEEPLPARGDARARASSPAAHGRGPRGRARCATRFAARVRRRARRPRRAGSWTGSPGTRSRRRRRVREVLGVPRSALSDDAAIALVLDPAQNRLLGREPERDDAVASSRARSRHASYTFRKRLSPHGRQPGPAPPDDAGLAPLPPGATSPTRPTT